MLVLRTVMASRGSRTAVRIPGKSMEDDMGSIARVTTITARSEKSFEDAIEQGVARSNETLRNVTGAWVKEQKVEVAGGNIKNWMVTLEVTFVLDD